MQLEKLKIVLIGPSESGKTTVANFLSESVNIDEAGLPRPTQGVRIVEFELPNINVNERQCKVDIELWDCSGDHKAFDRMNRFAGDSHGTPSKFDPDLTMASMIQEADDLLTAKINAQVIFYPENSKFAHGNAIKHLTRTKPRSTTSINTRFESCWPALRVGVQGVILVCSPNTVNVASREMELLYNYFVSQAKLSPKQCVVFYNCTDDQDDIDILNLSSTFSKVSQVGVNLKTGGNKLKVDFSNYVTSILQSLNK